MAMDQQRLHEWQAELIKEMLKQDPDSTPPCFFSVEEVDNAFLEQIQKLLLEEGFKYGNFCDGDFLSYESLLKVCVINDSFSKEMIADESFLSLKFPHFIRSLINRTEQDMFHKKLANFLSRVTPEAKEKELLAQRNLFNLYYFLDNVAKTKSAGQNYTVSAFINETDIKIEKSVVCAPSDEDIYFQKINDTLCSSIKIAPNLNEVECSNDLHCKDFLDRIKIAELEVCMQKVKIDTMNQAYYSYKHPIHKDVNLNQAESALMRRLNVKFNK